MQRIRTIVVSVTMCSCFVDNRIVGMSASEGAESSGSSTTTSAGQTPEMSATETSTTETSTTSPTSTGGDTSSMSDPTGAGCRDGGLTLAMTPECVIGSAIESVEWGDARCADALGVGWRWLSHHDQGGWEVTGAWIDEVGEGERGWAHIKDQNAECFSTPIVDVGNGMMSSYGFTWSRPAGLCQASCAPADGLEGPDFHPYAGQCNSYQGDTPCYLCRRLICVR
jgi:hypothetical protein